MSRNDEVTPITYHPVDGLEAEEVGYVEWLLSGGPPLPEYHALSWAPTQPGGLLL